MSDCNSIEPRDQENCFHPTMTFMKIASLLFISACAVIISLPFGGCAQQKEKPNTNPGPNPYYSRTDTTKLKVANVAWKRVLKDSVYQVAREASTEYPFTGKYWNYFGTGTYHCAVCGNALFKSDAKFASTCGWPSFFEPIRKKSVTYIPDFSHGMERIEVQCGRCDSHLGHIFDDGPPPTGKRFCMNSIVLEFVPDLHSKK